MRYIDVLAMHIYLLIVTITWVTSTSRNVIGADYIKQRFTPKGIENAMKLKEHWLKEAHVLPHNTFDSHLNWTPKQKRWFQSLGERLPMQKHLVKKEFRQLSDDERNRFFSALKRMRQERPDSDSPLSEYDILTSIHNSKSSPAAHMGAAFLPWHREYNYRFERALRTHDPTVTIPFWDTSLEARLSSPDETYLFTEELLGSGNGVIKSGHLAFWPISRKCHNYGLVLRRNVKKNMDGSLLSDADFNHILSTTKHRFKDIVSFVDQTMEMGHGHIHEWIGGHFNNITCSPEDPIFWMLHSLLDCLWEDYRQNVQRTPLTFDYPTNKDGLVGTNAHKASKSMIPFSPWLNIDGLSTFYTEYYYKCGKRPVHCRNDEDCGSKYIWCDTKNKKCMPKIKLGASCTDYPQRACYQSQCANGTCQALGDKESSSVF